MTEAVTISLIGALGAFAAAALSAATTVMLKRTKSEIVTLKEQTNHIKDALVKVTGESEYARGLKHGAESQTGCKFPGDVK